MLIIKPYGRSTTSGDDGKLSRQIILNADQSEKSIANLAKDTPELVIAQWISIIDKIARKPKQNPKPTKEQRDLREKLGKAAWSVIKSNELILNEADFETLWNWKIHPYPLGENEPNKNNLEKGRWYQRFAGDVASDKINAATIAQAIYEHLYEKAAPLNKETASKPLGVINARVNSITKNVLKPISLDDLADPPWSEKEENAYSQDDIAAQIFKKAKESQFYRLSDAAIILRKHYGRLFKDNGEPLSIAQAKENHPELLALHMAVKATYSGLRKRHRRENIASKLPKNMPELLSLVKNKDKNQQLNALVRLGKVIHYQASALKADSTINICTNWPADVSTSPYWTSVGQTQIKRNEAFVRVWRHIIAMAIRTLTDWTDPEGSINSDILGGNNIQSVTGNNFNSPAFEQKVALLFGSGAEHFTKCTDVKKQTLALALKGIATLRNSSFHFKGLASFQAALKKLNEVPLVS